VTNQTALASPNACSRAFEGQVGLAVVSAADRLGAERIEEVVAQVVVFERRIGHVAEEQAMNVRQEDVACLADGTPVVLDVQGDLEVVAPVAAFMTVGRKDWIVEEDP
jgi:hypothetical protein